MRSSEEDGILVTESTVGAVGITEVRFPPRYEQLRSTPERGYLAFVLDGALEKSFPRRMLVLPAGAAASGSTARSDSSMFTSQSS